MKKLLVLLAVISLLLLFCSKKSKTNEAKTQIDKEATVSVKTDRAPAISVDRLQIKELKYEPASPVPSTPLKIVASINENPEEEVQYLFTWVINNKEVEDITGDTLPQEKFNSGDWIFCRVKAVIPGLLQSPIKKSNLIQINPYPPELDLQPIPRFRIPGEFVYKIFAIDPNAKSDDDLALEDEVPAPNLKFKLISPLDAGIELDEDSGELRWNIPENPVETYGDTMRIKFTVTNAGGSVAATITLNLAKGKSTVREIGQ